MNFNTLIERAIEPHTQDELTPRQILSKLEEYLENKSIGITERRSRRPKKPYLMKEEIAKILRQHPEGLSLRRLTELMHMPGLHTRTVQKYLPDNITREEIRPNLHSIKLVEEELQHV